ALPVQAAPGSARDLTFEQRIEAQAAIERVRYQHQIDATLPFEQAVPRSVIERKVRDSLKQSLALEKYWATRVTGNALRHEMERMARATKMPERLNEIFAALHDDPYLIQECVARPALVSRLAHSFFDHDERIHAAARRAAEELRNRLENGSIDPHAE